MQAIILNSGIGKRLLSLTSVKPKCLLEIKGKKILEYQLEALTENNIENILITTGPFENQIKDFVSQRFPNLNITYVNNPKYETTNYIYSIWLAKNQIEDTVILLHGDGRPCYRW
ncbi:MAG: NTP transferase domain-containing protein [Candidatus Heimdallarchaeota archaeon]|nr:NTP transferase domain-containing protein [Candidatus Heimdallarchaeota archaeon]